MSTNSPSRKYRRGAPTSYTTCALYNTSSAEQKLRGLTLAACNPSTEKRPVPPIDTQEVEDEPGVVNVPSRENLKPADCMSCNFCDAVFQHRLEQKRHYKSDWHRYNLKQRLKARECVSEEQFETISGNISSLSGSDTDSDSDTGAETRAGSGTEGRSRKVSGLKARFIQTNYSSTDSESDSSSQVEEAARRLPKVYFRNENGELLSIYRCVISHKKWQPSRSDELITLATQTPSHMTWAVLMAGGGHFAAGIFKQNELVVHKTFHRYVVRAKRGTAQGSKDSQGNAPKSAGASLRRYNEAALIQDIQDLLTSWKDQLQTCDKIFLRAPSFNRKIFFSGKNPPLNKDDTRIRAIPFQTRRPTFNEVRRVYEVLSSIECYGDEADIQDFVPITPPQTFNRDTGQLTTKDENELTPKQRKQLNRKLRGSLPSGDATKTGDAAAGDGQGEGRVMDGGEMMAEGEPGLMSALPGHVMDQDNQSGSGTGSETELVEYMQTISLLEHKEFDVRKPKRRKKTAKKRPSGSKCQPDPESNVMEEEKYHLKNSLYTACKTGDLESLVNLLAVFLIPQEIIRDANTVVSQGGETGPNSSVIAVNQEEESDGKAENGDGSDREEILDKCCHDVQGDNAISYSKGDKEVVRNSKEKSEHIPNTTEECTSAKELTDISKEDQNFPSKICRMSSDLTDAPGKMNDHLQTFGSRLIVTQQCLIEEIPPDVSDTLSKSSSLKETPTIANPISENTDTKHNCDRTTEDEVTSTVNKFENMTENDKECVGSCSKETENEMLNLSNTKAEETLKVTIDADNGITETEPVSTDPAQVRKELVALDTSGSRPSVMSPWDMSPVVTLALLNESFGDSRTTLLHVAAKEGHKRIVSRLLESGANPALRDKGGQTPYMASKDKGVRNEFRRFMSLWPDKYDYAAAQIPAPLSEEQESERKRKEAEKKKAQKKVKQQKMKVKREEDEKKDAEEREKKRFLSLSDREKRALAAEKRLLNQAATDGGTQPVLNRCYQCADDISGKVPFVYNEFKFCTSKCLQMHRKSHTTR